MSAATGVVAKAQVSNSANRCSVLCPACPYDVPQKEVVGDAKADKEEYLAVLNRLMDRDLLFSDSSR
jgi:hypothetical protein